MKGVTHEDDENAIHPETVDLTEIEIRSSNEKFTGGHGPGLAILTEEVGELAEALLKHQADPTPERRAHIRAEAIQVIAMAVQLFEEGDETLGWGGALEDDDFLGNEEI